MKDLLIIGGLGALAYIVYLAMTGDAAPVAAADTTRATSPVKGLLQAAQTGSGATVLTTPSAIDTISPVAGPVGGGTPFYLPPDTGIMPYYPTPGESVPYAASPGPLNEAPGSGNHPVLEPLINY